MCLLMYVEAGQVKTTTHTNSNIIHLILAAIPFREYHSVFNEIYHISVVFVFEVGLESLKSAPFDYRFEKEMLWFDCWPMLCVDSDPDNHTSAPFWQAWPIPNQHSFPSVLRKS